MATEVMVLVGEDTLVAGTKNFKTGSRGFFGTGKVVVDGVRYQAQVQLVEIGSKPVTPEVMAAKADAKVERAAAALAKAKAGKAEMLAALKASKEGKAA